MPPKGTKRACTTGFLKNGVKAPWLMFFDFIQDTFDEALLVFIRGRF